MRMRRRILLRWSGRQWYGRRRGSVTFQFHTTTCRRIIRSSTSSSSTRGSCGMMMMIFMIVML